jgi:hypothetical protein
MRPWYLKCYDEAAMFAGAFESELHQFLKGMSVTSWIGHFLAIAVFGVAVPLRQGLDFLDVMFLLAYACLPCLFAAPLVAESVASRRTLPPFHGYIAQVLIPAIFAILWNFVILGSGILAVNASNWHGRLFLPPTPILLNILALCMGAVLFATAATGWLSLNVATATLAKSHARRVFLLALVAVLMYARMAPLSWKQNIESRLTVDGITHLLLPIAVLLGLLATLLIRAGAKRREEDSQGPLFRLT